MGKVLRTDLKIWHVLAIIIVMVVGTSTVVMARGGDDPLARRETSGAPRTTSYGADFWTKGTVRIASSYSNDATVVAPGPGDVTVLYTTFRVPATKKADIVATYSADGYVAGDGYDYLEFRLDSPTGAMFNPGEYWPVDGYVYNSSYPMFTATGFRKNISSGWHTIYVTMDASGAATLTLYDQSLTLLANIR